ncbi:MAG TPA: hypothetical protein VNA69_13125 [Thermoanaerobaculia bacterium]|nr:hypothetical protein [Thermoanaerobaculia bacterium]
MRRLLLILAIAAPLHADAVVDLRAALARLTAREPIRVTCDVQRAVNSEGKWDNQKFNGVASLHLEADAAGVRLSYPRSLLEQIERELATRAKDPKQPTPTVSAAQQIDLVNATHALDAAQPLLNMLDGAKVVEDRGGTWQGKPARVVIFRLENKPERGVGKVTVSENKLTLWLGADDVPLAAEHRRVAKFSLLFLKGESTSKHSWHFAHIGDRLVRTRIEESESGSGLGQKGTSSVVATLRVL